MCPSASVWYDTKSTGKYILYTLKFGVCMVNVYLCVCVCMWCICLFIMNFIDQTEKKFIFNNYIYVLDNIRQILLFNKLRDSSKTNIKMIYHSPNLEKTNSCQLRMKVNNLEKNSFMLISLTN